MASGREELRYTGSVEASFGETEGGAQAGTTSTDDDCIVFMVLRKNRVNQFRSVVLLFSYSLLFPWPYDLLYDILS